jgi:hypothetical protein
MQLLSKCNYKIIINNAWIFESYSLILYNKFMSNYNESLVKYLTVDIFKVG